MTADERRALGRNRRTLLPFAILSFGIQVEPSAGQPDAGGTFLCFSSTSSPRDHALSGNCDLVVRVVWQWAVSAREKDTGPSIPFSVVSRPEQRALQVPSVCEHQVGHLQRQQQIPLSWPPCERAIPGFPAGA